MTTQVRRYYCRVCKEGTPHEVEDGNGNARCIPCSAKQTEAAEQRRLELADELQRHLEALDGMNGPGIFKRRKH